MNTVLVASKATAREDFVVHFALNRGDRRLMPAIVLILKFLETDQIVGQHCSIALRKPFVV